jgi:DNA-binding transcriptional LysR family regulator
VSFKVHDHSATIARCGLPRLEVTISTTTPEFDATGREGWLGVELRHLAALVAIDRTGSFRGAAESLGYVQSAISQQIAYLERRLGTRLVHRSPGPGPVTLTEAGTVLRHHAGDILARMQAARADLTPMAGGATASLRIGVARPIATRLLGWVLPVFARAWPAVRIVPREVGSDDELLDLLEQGDIDVAFVELPARSGPFATVDLLSDPHRLLVHRESALAGLVRPLAAQDLMGTRLMAPGAPAQLTDHLRMLGIGVDPLTLSVTDATAQSLVSAAVGAAIVPRLAAEPRPVDVVALELGALAPPRRVVLRFHAQRRLTDVVAGFRDAAVTVCAGLEAPGAAHAGSV